MENDKLVRLSDVIATIENQCTDGNMWGNENLTLIDASKTIDELSDLPAVDAVEVVRCKDCRFNTTERKCLNPDSIIIVPSDDDFCSYGKRREDGLYESLKRGLEEAIAFENGEIECRTETREDGDA